MPLPENVYNRYKDMKFFQADIFSSVPSLIQAVEWRYVHGKDTIIIITGEKRSSKSWTSGRIAEYIKQRRGEKFDVNKACFFDPLPFLYWQRDAYEDVCIGDEFDQSCDAQEWYSVSNKVYKKIMSTEGFKRNVFIWTFPHLSSLDKRLLRLSHYHLKTLDTGVVACYRLKPEDVGPKIFRIYFGKMRVGPPSKDFIEAYEPMKKEWNDKRHQQMVDYFEMLEHPEHNKKAFSEKLYFKAFTSGVMTEDALRNKLIKLNYLPEDVDMVIKSLKPQITEEIGVSLNQMAKVYENREKTE